MKKLFFLFGAATIVLSSQAQIGNDLLKKVTGKSNNKSNLSTDEIANGLKEALNKGVTEGTTRLSAADGFFKDAAIKILMPPDAVKAEKTLRSIGLGQQVDDAILTMNRAAEDAAKSASPIFINAIKQMSIEDAWSILKGGDSAATKYLRTKTTPALTAAFKPVIDQSLEKTGATKYWNTAFTSYNKIAFNKVNPDLSAYVTEKALSGIFYQIALEEMQIRKDPVARTSDLLKKVFAN
ncbi:DUF4197 domain-containing protein [Panacibacter ginsenosidivorans]|uniref:DUF4197 domain-containing protein n=1 Tax=Panacibacter ginsenosidivorans TaxID=1813871 RepID=A0A5B8V755_9BACT|nr:DUF4197 domain-containing protein [Panacibacter ginsenosidivorans]QEC67244.1 DUF4197 domain-containing protein [Panacibacter ginsenosidivorans]